MTETITALIEKYRQERDRLEFMDCNMWIGRSPVPDFFQEVNLDELRWKMERYHIQGGVVSHFGSVNYGAEWGNQTLLDSLQGTGLWGAVVLMPEMFYEPASGRAYLHHLVQQGARLIRLFPKSHTYTLRAWSCSELLSALVDFQLPLVVWHTEISWNEIHDLCAAYPELTIIVEGNPQKIMYHNRQYYPLLRRFQNLRLELHNLIAYLSLEDMVAHFGSRPFLFGSNIPVWDANVTMMNVTHARFAEDDKMKIAHGNLVKLIEGVITS